MDLERLIEAVKLCGSTPKVDQCKQCAYWAGGDMSRCIPNMTGDAATALSVLQAENEKLRAKLEDCRSGACATEKARDFVIAKNKKLRADLARVTAERDAAVWDLETTMAHVNPIFDTCGFCKNAQCYARGGIEFCHPEWRGIRKEE